MDTARDITMETMKTMLAVLKSEASLYSNVQTISYVGSLFDLKLARMNDRRGISKNQGFN